MTRRAAQCFSPTCLRVHLRHAHHLTVDQIVPINSARARRHCICYMVTQHYPENRRRISPKWRVCGTFFCPCRNVIRFLFCRSAFPCLAELEAAAPIIIREMNALARAGGGNSYDRGTGEMSTAYGATKGWGTMRIRYMGRYSIFTFVTLFNSTCTIARRERVVVVYP